MRTRWIKSGLLVVLWLVIPVAVSHPTGARNAEPAPPRFMYKMRWINLDTANLQNDDSVNRLNKLGGEGWELVGITSTESFIEHISGGPRLDINHKGGYGIFKKRLSD